MPAKTVAVVGYKNSGKTRVVEILVKELTKHGKIVGTLKHTADDITLDTPGKDTFKHREAGSTATAIIQENTAAIFLDQYLTLQQAAKKLESLDYLIIEGFKTKNTHARIIVPRTNDELRNLRNGLEIAIVKLPESKFNKKTELPVFNNEQASNLIEVVKERAYPMLPGLDCHSCGYPDCISMGRGLLAGEAVINQCVGYGSTFNLRVNDIDVPLGNFTKDVIQNVMLGLVKTLKGGENARKIHLEFEKE
jgi:molybdopterin-guanine dinucleotide biosynthesis protein B